MKKIVVIGTERMGGAFATAFARRTRTRFRCADRMPAVLRQPRSAVNWACGWPTIKRFLPAMFSSSRRRRLRLTTVQARPSNLRASSRQGAARANRFIELSSAHASRAFCQGFFRWYNEEHRHSSLGSLTPATVHYGQAESVLQQRQAVLDVAYQLHPERLVRSAPKPPQLPGAVWINKPVSVT